MNKDSGFLQRHWSVHTKDLEASRSLGLKTDHIYARSKKLSVSNSLISRRDLPARQYVALFDHESIRLAKGVKKNNCFAAKQYSIIVYTHSVISMI